MATQQQHLVIAQFGPQAAAYAASAVHAQGADLDQLAEILRERPAARALDLGCGGGHVSLRIAPFVEHVTAYDLTEPMLAMVEKLGAERGLANISVRQGAAEMLPFEDGSFDLVLSRYSAHHWSDLGTALREARRVLAPNGRAIFIDVVSPKTPVFDTYLQSVELLRDPSHIRDYSETEWGETLRGAGFTPGAVTRRRLWLDFVSWTARIGTPAPHVAAIRSLQNLMTDEVKAYFQIEADGSFTVDTAMFEALR